MCLPAIPAAIQLAVTIGSMVMSAATSIMGGIQQQRMAEYNAKMQENQAKSVVRAASYDVGIQREKTRIMLGQQRVLMGASGAVADEGSFGDVLAQTAEFGERDAQRIRMNADNQAYGMRAQAALDRYQGTVAFQGGLMKAGGTMLAGVSNMMGPNSPWFSPLQGTNITLSDMTPNAMTEAATSYGV